MRRYNSPAKILYIFMSGGLGFSDYVMLREDFRSKTPLYPLGYGGIGLYPTQYFIPYSADAVLYITQDERLYTNGDGPPHDIRHLPGHKQYGDKCNNGEGEPFAIKDVPGRCEEPEVKMPPGKVIPYRGFLRLNGALRALIPRNNKMPPE